MKREADAPGGGPGGPAPNKRYRQGDEELRFLIPSRIAGSIIGRGGQNIAKLRSQYKASITVPDCYGPERILTISSDLEQALTILNELIPKLEESSPKNGNEADLDLRMLVHQSQAGCVIGKGGGKIKELREINMKSVFVENFDSLVNVVSRFIIRERRSSLYRPSEKSQSFCLNALEDVTFLENWTPESRKSSS
ncbi:hypothetical protein TKK_0001500 [Trichogramma kaykai]|uniref:K Homology domain-containing protein n=1 Tax=Trichogramma kaykai TaxID=54128 RepID=A0ABD2X108_9HYME